MVSGYVSKIQICSWFVPWNWGSYDATEDIAIYITLLRSGVYTNLTCIQEERENGEREEGRKDEKNGRGEQRESKKEVEGSDSSGS